MKTLLEHLIISHHGQYEFGSPKLPMFPEALMLHYLDDLDSKMESMRAHAEREGNAESPWTGYNPSLGRSVLKTAKFLETKPVNDTAAAEQAANNEQSESPATQENLEDSSRSDEATGTAAELAGSPQPT
jgi:3'-5' exoribonuclease